MPQLQVLKKQGKTAGAMRFNPGVWIKLILPGVLVAAAYWGRGNLNSLPDDTRVIVANSPYLLCLLAALVAYQFNRSRFVLAALGVAGFYWVVRSQLQVSLVEPEAASIFLSLSLCCAVLGLYLLLIPERGLLTLPGAVTVMGFLLLGLMTYYLGPKLAGANPGAAQYYSAWSSETNVLSRGVTVLVGLVVLIGVGVLALHKEEADASLLGAFIALCLVLSKLHLPEVSMAMCSVAAVCVLLGVLRSSHAMAYRDDLTGLPGRRALNERLKMLGRRYTIAMLDIDHFKRFNDKYGHDVGDDVLRLVASRISRVRGGGTAFRYGGEEFCVLFPRRTLEECVEPMEQVREAIADYKMSIRNRGTRPQRSREGVKKRGATRLRADEVSMTVSIGLAERNEEFPDADAVIKAADQKLYKAKRAGRNRLVS